MADHAPPDVEHLSSDECRRLLQRGGVGCIGLAAVGAPVLRPVNFTVHGDAIVIRTGEGRILEAARRGDPAAFAVDAADRLEHTGWSVIAEGKLSVLPTDEVTLGLPLRAWADGRKDRFVAISLDQLSGRRIPAGRGNR